MGDTGDTGRLPRIQANIDIRNINLFLTPQFSSHFSRSIFPRLQTNSACALGPLGFIIRGHLTAFVAQKCYRCYPSAYTISSKVIRGLPLTA